MGPWLPFDGLGGKPYPDVENDRCVRWTAKVARVLVARWLEPRGLFDATRGDVETFLDQRRTREGRQIISRTRRLWPVHLHGFYRWAVKEELTATDPTAAIVRPRTLRPEHVDIRMTRKDQAIRFRGGKSDSGWV